MLQLLSVELDLSATPFDLIDAIRTSIKARGVAVNTGDIILVSSKHVAMSQGRIVKLTDVIPSEKAADLAARLQTSPQLTELLLRETDEIVGRDDSGALITVINGTYFQNAGMEVIDAQAGLVSLPPVDPVETARRIRQRLQAEYLVMVGVVIASQVILVGRKGTGGVALAASGFNAVVDERGKPDLFGNPMKHTTRGLANMLAGAAQLLISDADVFVVAKESGAEMLDASFSFEDMGIPPENDLFPHKGTS